MSDQTPDPAQHDPQTAPIPAGMSAATIRQIVLFGILLVGLAALGYDYKIARAGIEKAHADLETEMDTRAMSGASGGAKGGDDSDGDAGDEELTAADYEAAYIATRLDRDGAEEIIGKKPSDVKEGKYYQWVKYSWMAGAPWRSYDLWIVYEPFKGKYYCVDVAKNQEPDNQFPLSMEKRTLDATTAGNDGGGGVPNEDGSITNRSNLGPVRERMGGGRRGGGGEGGGRRGGGGGREGGGGGFEGRGGGGPSRADRQRPAMEDEPETTTDPKPETTDPKPETPEPKPETPEPKPETPEPKPETPEPKPETPEPKPETPEPKPEAPEPKPETPEPNDS